MLINMIHDNYGEPRFKTLYRDPQVLSGYGYEAIVIPEALGAIPAAYEAGARLAREVADEFEARDGHRRWVAGSVGPGLPHLCYPTKNGCRNSRRSRSEPEISGLPTFPYSGSTLNRYVSFRVSIPICLK